MLETRRETRDAANSVAITCGIMGVSHPLLGGGQLGGARALLTLTSKEEKRCFMAGRVATMKMDCREEEMSGGKKGWPQGQEGAMIY